MRLNQSRGRWHPKVPCPGVPAPVASGAHVMPSSRGTIFRRLPNAVTAGFFPAVLRLVVEWSFPVTFGPGCCYLTVSYLQAE